jgi:hypothetical protein
MSVINQKRKLDDSIGPLSTLETNGHFGIDGMMNTSLDDCDIAWDECQRMIENMTLQMQFKSSNNSKNTNNNDTKLVQEFLQSISLMEEQINHEYETNVQNESIVLKQKLQERIIKEQEQIQQQEQYLLQLQSKFSNILQEKQEYEHQVQQLSKEEQQLQQTISTYKQQVNLELNEMEQIQDICKQKVPRLRQQLSLYGNVTGIKWNFHNTTINNDENNNHHNQQQQFLIGQVVRTNFFYFNKFFTGSTSTKKTLKH